MALAWFPCYVNDLLGSLSWRCMTPAQRGAYWQLICCQMQAEDGMLPDGIAMLSRLADLDLSGENSVVLEKFPPTESGKRANPRAYSEWLKRQDISEKRSNAGAIGGASKKQLPEQTPSNCLSKPEADVKQTGDTTTTTSTGTPDSKNPQPKKTTRAQAPAADSLYRYAELAAIYPPDKAKPDAEARRWWPKNADTDEKIDLILANTHLWLASAQYQASKGWNIGRYLSEGMVFSPPGKPTVRANPEKQHKSDLQKEIEFQANEKRLWDEAVARGDELPQ